MIRSIGIICFFLIGCRVCAQTNDFELIMKRIRNGELLKTRSLEQVDYRVSQYLGQMDAEGAWADVDYDDNSRTGWKPLIHLQRLYQMALSYLGGKYKGNEAVYASIVKGLEYWNHKNPVSLNWFQQQIAVPQQLGRLLILMRGGDKKIPEDLETILLTHMEKTGGRPDQRGSQGTAANKIDIATHWIYRGLLTADTDVLSFGIDQLILPIEFTTGEGLQHDYSYLQHDQQLHIGGYGNIILNAIPLMAVYLQGTKYEIPREKLELVADFALNTYLQVIRGQYMHFNVFGRGIANKGTLYFRSVGMFETLSKLDVENRSDILKAIKRLSGEKTASYGVNNRFRHYWRADYSLYNSPAYAFDVRSVSKRTCRNENGNGQNLKGYFLADGATNISVDGDEYLDIAPIWDWSMIPGTTTPHVPSAEIPLPHQWGVRGTVSFVGGVSDGRSGISVYDYQDGFKGIDSRARKSWFFLGQEVVCLGSGINSENHWQVNTTLNQCLSKGEVQTCVNGEISSVSGEAAFEQSPDWVYHGGIGYVFIPGQQVEISHQLQEGDWHTINSNLSKEVVSDSVFKLWINHGVHPKNETYAYIVVPGVKSVEKLNSYIQKNDIWVMLSDSIHVVNKNNTWYFAFFKTGSFEYEDFRLTVDKPCVLILQNLEKRQVTGFIADPSQTHENITLKLEWKNKTCKKATCFLPDPLSPFAGSSVSLILK